MDDRISFSELNVGDVFKFGVVEMVKVSSDYDSDLSIPDNTPNALRLSNTHYCVVHPDAKVYLIKTRNKF